MGLFPGAWICVEGGHTFHTLEQVRSIPTPACCNNAGETSGYVRKTSQEVAYSIAVAVLLKNWLELTLRNSSSRQDN